MDPYPRKVTGPQQVSRVFDTMTRLISNTAAHSAFELPCNRMEASEGCIGDMPTTRQKTFCEAGV